MWQGDRLGLTHIFVCVATSLVCVAASLAFGTGCGGRSATTPVPRLPCDVPSKPLPIDRVEVLGNDEVTDSELTTGLATRGPDCWLPYVDWIRCQYTQTTPIELERDRVRIERFYHGLGYFSAQVTEVEVCDLGPADEPMAEVRFYVAEGEPAILADVVIAGAPETSADQDADGSLTDRFTDGLADSLLEVAPRPDVDARSLRSLTGLDIGQPFVYAQYTAAQTALARALSTAGYAHASVKGAVAVDRVAGQVVVRFDIDAGPLVRFGKTVVEGQTIVPEASIRNRVLWRQGAIFDPRQVSSTRQRLQAMRRFDSVRIDFTDSTDSEVEDVRVAVSDGPRQEIKLGGGSAIDSENWDLHGRAGYRIFGLPDSLSTFTATLRPALVFRRGDVSDRSLEIEASAALTRDDLLLPLVQGEASAAYKVDVYDAYSSVGPHTRIGLQRPFVDHYFFVGIGWRYVWLHRFYNVDDNLGDEVRSRVGIGDNYFLGVLEQSLIYDRRDSPLDPRVGVYAQIEFNQSGPFSLSEFSYATMAPELRAYASLGDRLTVAVRGHHSRLLWGDDLPIGERLYSGGATSQRGFSQRALSPADGGDGAEYGSGSVEYGGNAVIELSFETRFRIVQLYGQWLGLVLFVDGADVTNEAADLPLDNLGNLHWAAGAGLRIYTPVGPLRFDYGYRLNRCCDTDEPWPGNSGSFHFSIGEAF